MTLKPYCRNLPLPLMVATVFLHGWLDSQLKIYLPLNAEGRFSLWGRSLGCKWSLLQGNQLSDNFHHWRILLPNNTLLNVTGTTLLGNLPFVGIGVCEVPYKVPGIRLFVCLIFLFTFSLVAVEGLIWKALQSHFSIAVEVEVCLNLCHSFPFKNEKINCHRDNVVVSLELPVNNSLYHKKKIYIFCHKPLISRHSTQNEHSNYIIFHPEVEVIVKDLRTSLYCSCLHLELSELRKTCLMDTFLFCINFFFKALQSYGRFN